MLSRPASPRQQHISHSRTVKPSEKERGGHAQRVPGCGTFADKSCFEGLCRRTALMLLLSCSLGRCCFRADSARKVGAEGRRIPETSHPRHLFTPLHDSSRGKQSQDTFRVGRGSACCESPLLIGVIGRAPGLAAFGRGLARNADPPPTPLALGFGGFSLH